MEARLIKLEIEGFRSFKNKATFEFPQGDAVVLISGKWKDSPVSSGSGKTSVIEALAFLLDISSSSMSSLKNWESKKMCVKGTFRIGDSIVEATRDPKLSLVIDGEPYTSLSKGAKEKLQEMLGGNEEMIKSITYRKQRVHGKLVNSTDSEIKEFLTNPLGLNEIEAAADNFSQQANRLQANIDLLKRDEASLASTIPMNYVSDEEIAAQRQNYQNAVAAYESALSAAGSSESMKSDLRQVQDEINKINQLSMSIQMKKNENSNIRDTVVRLQSEVEKLQKNTCPRCEREWDKSGDQLHSINAQIDSMMNTFRANLEYVKNAEPIMQNLPALQQRMQDINRKLGEASAPIQSAHSAVSSADYALKAAESKKRNMLELQARLNKVRADISAQENERLVAETAAKLIGRSGFMGSIFDEILADIESRSNDMLQHFPNAAQFTIQINSTKVVKTKGTTKKEISVTVSRGGVDVNLSDLSGGQQSAIELCTDLAAAEAVRSRSGCSIKWICLDEVMDGLGSSEKEEVVEMIKRRVKGLVLMIEHATEIKESFDTTIDIEFDGRESYVKTG